MRWRMSNLIWGYTGVQPRYALFITLINNVGVCQRRLGGASVHSLTRPPTLKSNCYCLQHATRATSSIVSDVVLFSLQNLKWPDYSLASLRSEWSGAQFFWLLREPVNSVDRSAVAVCTWNRMTLLGSCSSRSIIVCCREGEELGSQQIHYVNRIGAIRAGMYSSDMTESNLHAHMTRIDNSHSSLANNYDIHAYSYYAMQKFVKRS